ncbi:mechanosensitive ion channel family protein [Algicella marina]|uniref:Small-conductance mechanosensitive channel n=1 Tax=Algicella marina TaxID=2683284 RepID=A0A6P1SWH2_9RHOB|nr:mechanosensitive ion channel domain-containing protein [Algicella marina]QHQ35024.1 mechanosensitive ion channel [Algicella marina]
MFRLFAILLLLSATPLAAQTGEETAPSGPIAVEADAGTDSAIATKIRGILTQIDGFGQVRVSVSSGVVTLSGNVRSSAELEELEALVTRVEGVAAIRNQVAETTDLSERLTPVVDRFQNRVDTTIAFLPLLAVAFLAFLAITILGFFLAARSFPFNRIAPNAFIADIYRQILRIAFAIAGLVIALDILDATALLGTILGAAGIIGLAIGFAVKDTVENFIASIMLSIRQPFEPNDVVEIEGDIGNVIRLTSRATVLLSPDGNHIRIPNSLVFKSRIVNYTRNAERRFDFTLGIDADADIAAARDTAQAALESLPFVLSAPAPATWVQDVGDSNVLLFLAGWIDQRETDFARARGEAIRTAKSALETAGFGLPEPIYRLRFDDARALLTATETDRQSTPAPQPRPAPAPAAAVQTEKDDTIEKLVEEERETTEDDLLSKQPRLE